MAASNLQEGFVYLADVDKSIIQSLRYATTVNFMGEVIEGYSSSSSAVMTEKAANALAKAQKQFLLDGYSLVLYDSFRPQRAVDHFVKWSQDLSSHGQQNKELYFPRVDKSKVFELGYIAERSGHSRGSTVDVTLIESSKILRTIVHSVREYPQLPGYTIPFLDDNTVDMGSSFDLFDEASHHDSALVLPEHSERRNYLRKVMGDCGFSWYDHEWWHYTLKEEPFPHTYFDFTW